MVSFARAAAPEPVRVLPLGRVDYDAAWGLQKALQGARVEAKRRGEALPHLLLLVEHPPVLTLGQSGDRTHVLLSDAELAARGIAFRHIDRGGDVTYHGPGQLVGYPILDLDRFTPDLHRYLRTLEDVMIATCASAGLAADALRGRPWQGADGRVDRAHPAWSGRCAPSGSAAPAG